MATEGADVILAGKMSNALKDKIHPRISLAGKNGNLQGVAEIDDIHLIIEYKRDEKWGKYKSPRANRFENLNFL